MANLDSKPNLQLVENTVEPARPSTRANEAMHPRVMSEEAFSSKVLQDAAYYSDDTALVFHCHHGGRSQAAADHYLKHGFTTVYNVAGGIDAWSSDVDPTVPRY